MPRLDSSTVPVLVDPAGITRVSSPTEAVTRPVARAVSTRVTAPAVIVTSWLKVP